MVIRRRVDEFAREALCRVRASLAAAIAARSGLSFGYGRPPSTTLLRLGSADLERPHRDDLTVDGDATPICARCEVAARSRVPPRSLVPGIAFYLAERPARRSRSRSSVVTLPGGRSRMGADQRPSLPLRPFIRISPAESRRDQRDRQASRTLAQSSPVRLGARRWGRPTACRSDELVAVAFGESISDDDERLALLDDVSRELGSIAVNGMDRLCGDRQRLARESSMRVGTPTGRGPARTVTEAAPRQPRGYRAGATAAPLRVPSPVEERLDVVGEEFGWCNSQAILVATGSPGWVARRFWRPTPRLQIRA